MGRFAMKANGEMQMVGLGVDVQALRVQPFQLRYACENVGSETSGKGRCVSIINFQKPVRRVNRASPASRMLQRGRCRPVASACPGTP